MAQVSLHQGSGLSPLLFAITANAISENAREGLMNKILYANDLVLMSESTENWREKFSKWKAAFNSKKLKVNSRRPK